MGVGGREVIRSGALGGVLQGNTRPLLCDRQPGRSLTQNWGRKSKPPSSALNPSSGLHRGTRDVHCEAPMHTCTNGQTSIHSSHKHVSHLYAGVCKPPLPQAAGGPVMETKSPWVFSFMPTLDSPSYPCSGHLASSLSFTSNTKLQLQASLKECAYISSCCIKNYPQMSRLQPQSSSPLCE